RFLEKPSRDQITTNMINAGVYILENEVLDSIPANTNYSFERQLFPDLLQRGQPVFAFASEAYWIDIGKPETYLQTHLDLIQGKSRNYAVNSRTDIRMGTNCRLDPSARLEGPLLIGDNCEIGPRASLIGPLVLGAGSSIQADAVVQSSVLWPNVVCSAKTCVKNSLIANDCVLGQESCVESSLIGCHITLTPRTRLGPGSRIWPPA
ncbi:MAG TPA: NDP-sugar synthase, partial [Dehalococcoidales bacterium]|nr:NDP-sugar synthase [Dehalococcoidales bacterium]